MNFEKYIGLPYQENGRTWQGVDCWGLARLFYKHELNIDLPDYSDLYSGSWDEQVSKLINQYKDTWTKATKPSIGDLCLFNIYGEPAHIGIYTGSGKFLHSRSGKDSVIESLLSPQWSRRLAGYYKYQHQHIVDNIQLTGLPHPLRVQKITDWAKPGTALIDVVKFIHKKYDISKKLTTRLVLMVDGVPVPQDKWDTTILREGQQVAYRTLAQGSQGFRMILTIALIVVTAYFAPGLGQILLPGAAPAIQAVVGAMVINTAGQALINAIAPIRPESQPRDPGQPNQINLFNGSSNQASRLGAIPVVLGKIRYAGLLGANTYVQTHTETNVLNLLIIWGFGPLHIQSNSILVGNNNLTEYYFEDLGSDAEKNVITLPGAYNETADEAKTISNIYSFDVEQIFAQQGELVNNATDGNPWREITFSQESTRIEVVFNFPQGLRTINTQTGEVTEAVVRLEVEHAPITGTFGATPSFRPGNGDPTVTAFEKTINSPTPEDCIINPNDSYYFNPVTIPPIYRWHYICVHPNGSIVHIEGRITDVPSADASSSLVNAVRQNNMIVVDRQLVQPSVEEVQTFLKGTDAVPSGYVKLYSYCLNQTGTIEQTIDHRSTLIGGVTGLTATATPNTIEAGDPSNQQGA